MAITDRYQLASGPLITVDGHVEETSNLQLQATPASESGVVSGIVQRPDGTAIPSATVTLYNSNGLPFEHINTNAAGRFVFPRVPAGSYSITSAEPNYLTPVRTALTVIANRTTTVTITMQTDPDANRNAIFGTVQSSTTNTPVDDVTVELFRVAGTTTELVGIVNSNQQGQYLFANLVDGNYYISVSRIGYLSNESAQVNLSNREFAPINIFIAVDPNANTNTISGTITDSSTGQALANAIVAIYSVTNGTESIINITKTNAGGFYLFGDLPAGTYRVKATVQVEV